MVRSALGRSGELERRPKKLVRYIPASSVAATSLLALLPIVVELGWAPDFAFLLLLAWRLLRSDVIPAWWAAPLGLVNDLVTGLPIGFSVVLWTFSIMALDLLDRRTMWRDYWVEWALAGALLLVHEVFRWWVDAAMGAPYPFHHTLIPLMLAVLTFPLAAWTASRLDRWRLGR